MTNYLFVLARSTAICASVALPLARGLVHELKAVFFPAFFGSHAKPHVRLSCEQGNLFQFAPKARSSRLCRREDEGMVLRLAPDEPEAGPWRTEPLTVLVEALTQRVPGGIGRPIIVAIDGRSNGGKTSLATRVGDAVPRSAVIHTDDIAWEHSRFGWADLLIDGIPVPVHRGEAVSYRPPRWVERGREGSIDVPAACPLLIIEGDGAGRREVAHLMDALIWVQSDNIETERRRLARERNADSTWPTRPWADRLSTTRGGWPRKYRSTRPSGAGSGPTSS